ncbi:TetR/AcrR family transcriptional regulator [Nonomuraea terrae]|uniref:TetR/AcrR family transcriptional regulator n=1 Tax=Nonomuraea terrae TaxID=2530383 RepID=A0A4R4Z5V1_9ACTN|nr:TetR/AcrR family transcriptional regulator [Nonomuraea terrae]
MAGYYGDRWSGCKGVGVRADAVRNREAILRATEELLEAHGAEHVSLDRVAAAAGVGKGTVFRRFGSRTGLFQELLAERAAALGKAVQAAGSPLGPGAPPLDRLLAFVDELAELAERNLALFAAHERACAEDKYRDPTYLRWHAHVSALIAEARPGMDAGFAAHALLGSFDADLARHVMADGGVARLKSSVRGLVRALLT